MRTVLLLLPLALAGCAFTDVPVDMPIKGLATPLTGGNGRRVAVVAPFTDQRRQANRCGMQKNGYNMDTANVVCRTPPASWVAEVLADELRAAGFTVLPADAAAPPGALRIEGSLLELFIEPLAGAFSASCEADLQVRLVVTSGSGLRATRTFFAKGEWRGFAGITGPFQVALDKASQELLGEMVAAILELVNRYPQLGAWQRGPACVS
jgi:hypothetical protein